MPHSPTAAHLLLVGVHRAGVSKAPWVTDWHEVPKSNHFSCWDFVVKTVLLVLPALPVQPQRAECVGGWQGCRPPLSQLLPCQVTQQEQPGEAAQRYALLVHTCAPSPVLCLLAGAAGLAIWARVYVTAKS